MSAMPVPNMISWLENGDTLMREEFEHCLDATPRLKGAELIEGIVFIPGAVLLNQQSAPHTDLISWLGTYGAKTPGVKVRASCSVRLDSNNMPQPNALMLILPAHGGQARISADDYIEGAPEFIAEVSSSSVSIDLHAKLRAYERNGVREYVVWRVLDRAIDWFVVRDGQFVLMPPGIDGIVCSEVFPGLWLDPAALTKGDLVAALSGLQRGLESPEHAAFVARLQQRSETT